MDQLKPTSAVKPGETSQKITNVTASGNTEDSEEVSNEDNEEVKLRCPSTGCSLQARKNELEMHTATAHGFHLCICDHEGCILWYYRIDQLRDHLRDEHKEDLPQKGKGNWYTSRQFSEDWWRCTRCLRRIECTKPDWKCGMCRISCEPDRVTFRSMIAKNGDDKLSPIKRVSLRVAIEDHNTNALDRQTQALKKTLYTNASAIIWKQMFRGHRTVPWIIKRC